MSGFEVTGETQMCELLDRMTAQKEFWQNSVPTQLNFQRFGFQLREADLEQKSVKYNGFKLRNRNQVTIENSGLSIVRNGKKEFVVELDVWPFKHNEITVMVVPGKYITIKGEHEERDEDGSKVSRKFQRYYHLPKGSDSNRMKCDYCNDVVMIRVPKDVISDEMCKSETVPLNLSSSRNVPLPSDRPYDPQELESAKKVSISFQNEGVTNLQIETPNSTEIQNNEASSKSDGEQDRKSREGCSEDSKNQEDNKGEIDPSQTTTKSSESTPMDKEVSDDISGGGKGETTDAGK